MPTHFIWHIKGDEVSKNIVRIVLLLLLLHHHFFIISFYCFYNVAGVQCLCMMWTTNFHNWIYIWLKHHRDETKTNFRQYFCFFISRLQTKSIVWFIKIGYKHRKDNQLPDNYVTDTRTHGRYNHMIVLFSIQR